MLRTEWFKRTFPKIDDHGRLPTIIERLTDGPIRIQHRVSGIPEESATQTIEGKWSIKKEIGHLIDLEPLWYGRVIDLQKGEKTLREADLTNRKTEETDHNSRSLSDLLEEFASKREKLISEIEKMSQTELERSALHPRLQTPMHMVDLAYFVAEHDDHHLSQITWIKGKV